MKTIRRNPFVPVPDGNESLMPLEEGNLKSIPKTTDLPNLFPGESHETLIGLLSERSGNKTCIIADRLLSAKLTSTNHRCKKRNSGIAEAGRALAKPDITAPIGIPMTYAISYRCHGEQSFLERRGW
jgi:hypothetical protein